MDELVLGGSVPADSELRVRGDMDAIQRSEVTQYFDAGMVRRGDQANVSIACGALIEAGYKNVGLAQNQRRIHQNTDRSIEV